MFLLSCFIAIILFYFFFFNDTATTEIYTLSLHDALPIRESVVMSLTACIGPEINLLGETPDHCHQLVMEQPILRNSELEKLRQVDHSVFEARSIDMTWPVESGEDGMERRIEAICREAS